MLLVAGDNPTRLRNDAALAALCGASPIEASSGKTTRHRLNRGGDRQANSALWLIANNRMIHHPQTRDYVDRRTAEGKSTKEIRRCLMRHIARGLYRLLIADLTDAQRPPRPRSINAVAESFFATLKKELVNRRPWPPRPSYAAEIFDYIEVFFSRGRRERARHDLPADFENRALGPSRSRPRRFAARVPPDNEIHCTNHRRRDLINPCPTRTGGTPELARTFVRALAPAAHSRGPAR